MAAKPEKEAIAVELDDGELQNADATVQLAHEVEQIKYSAWSPNMFRLYLALSCAYLCGCLNGFDGSLMGGLNGMTSYQKYFNMSVYY
jgi:hypothetical protein